MTSARDEIIDRLADVGTALDTRHWDALGALFTGPRPDTARTVGRRSSSGCGTTSGDGI